jgi:hypothetical protein
MRLAEVSRTAPPGSPKTGSSCRSLKFGHLGRILVVYTLRRSSRYSPVTLLSLSAYSGPQRELAASIALIARVSKNL